MSVTGRAESEGNPLIGVTLLVCGTSLAAIGDAIAKFLGEDLHVLQIIWARYVFALLPLAPLVFYHLSPRELASHLSPLEALRALAMTAVTFFYLSAIQFLPLADALGLLFLYPLLATGLAALFLGERVSPTTIFLSVIAFAGALLVIRPGFGEMNIGALLAALGAISIATNLVINRKLAGKTPVFAGIFFATLLGVVISVPIVPFVWVQPSSEQWVLLIGLGMLSSVVTWMIYSAFLHGPASVIAPFGYSEIITATLLGYIVFADFPDGFTIAGIAVICLAGIVMAIRKGA